MPPEKRKPEEEPEAAKSPAVSTHEVTQPSAPPPTQATSSEGASGSPERADKSDVHGTKAGAENANEEHDARENSDGEEAKMKTQHRSSVTRENQVKAGIEENRHPVKEALKDSPNHDSQSPEVTSKAVSSGDDVNDSLKSLKKRLSAALENVSGKEDSVKQLSKVAEEAVAGWEKAENEVASLKPHLEAAVRQLRQLKGDIANAKDGVSQKENGELQAQLAFCSPVVIPLEVCTTSSENPSLIKTRSLDTKGSEDVEAGGVGGDDEEDEEDDEEEEDDEDDEEEEDHEEEEDEEDHEEEEDDEDDEEEEDDEEDVEDEEPLHLIFAQNVVAGGVVGDDEEDVEDEEPLHLIFAQNVEAGGVVGDDVEDVEDEEPLRYVYPLRHAYRFEDQIRVYYVYYTAPEMRFERLNPIGDISLSAHRDIHEVHREVWRIIFTFVSNVEFLRSRPREELFFWYIRYTEDGRWEYLSRHAWCWPWDRFFREADGVVVTHHDPEPQLLPALGDNVIYGEADGVVGDDEEDVEDEEPLHLVNLFERRIMVYHVYYTAPEMRSERLDLVGDINLDNYGDINEVHQEVWRIVKMLASNVEFFTDRPRSALFGCRIELFGWYIRFTEDGGWEYLSRRACDWPWDRFYREADGVVVSHEDPEPQVPAL